MIYICCGELDTGFSTAKTAEKLKNDFGSEKTDKYIDKILSRKNAGSVKQSLCALNGLAWLLDTAKINKNGLIIGRNTNNKPFFENSDMCFSLSHSENLFACALSACDVGIDIEASLLSADRIELISKKFFKPTEQEFVLKNPPKNFLKIWTAKESYTKMLGITLPEGFAKCDYLDTENFFVEFEYKGAVVTVSAPSLQSINIYAL